MMTTQVLRTHALIVSLVMGGAVLPQDSQQTQTQTIGLGQTPAQVTAILGSPKQIIDLGAKQIYKYPDMKVVFVNGKVSDVQ